MFITANCRVWIWTLVTLLSGLLTNTCWSQNRALHTFERRQLTDVYYSEGANAGDINRDGKPDLVYGPHWYAGPMFTERHEIYPARPQNRKGYADNFFNWIYDFNGDGWNDILVVGLPGTPAFVFENPRGADLDQAWKKHTVFPAVGNEAPHFLNLTGDARPELVCTFKGSYGFVTFDVEQPLGTWTFHRISDQAAPDPFGHGLGVGDINGDGRSDILCMAGWFEQPAEHADTAPWTYHPVKFSNAYGGAEMFAYDVDGDGDNDVITSLAAHDFGLAWYEQELRDGERVFRQHLIMGDKPEQNRYGVVFSELHSLALVDVDGDGLKDIVTGKTYYSHHDRSPMWDAGAVVYWFRLTRAAGKIDWVPYRIDGEAGIGRQVSIADVNGDKLPDVVLGGMVGGHVLIHKQQTVSEAEWKQAQPMLFAGFAETAGKSVSPAFGADGRVVGALEGEQLKVLAVSAGQTAIQEMQGFAADRWSGDKHLFWTGGQPGATLELELPVATSGTWEIVSVFTMARDYGVIRVAVDGQPLKADLDLYHAPDVITTGEVVLGKQKLEAGQHKLQITITGTNPAAVKAYMVGLDFVALRKVP